MFANDIALLKLEKGVSRKYWIPMCDRSYKKYTLVAAGTGLTNGRVSNSHSPILLETRLIESESKCPWRLDFDKQVCLYGTDSWYSGSACQGDSGGPIYPIDKDDKPLCVYGIASFVTSGCEDASVYTRVSGYLNWIKSNW